MGGGGVVNREGRLFKGGGGSRKYVDVIERLFAS